jgi:hypothetical protein
MTREKSEKKRCEENILAYEAQVVYCMKSVSVGVIAVISKVRHIV